MYTYYVIGLNPSNLLNIKANKYGISSIEFDCSIRKATVLNKLYTARKAIEEIKSNYNKIIIVGYNEHLVLGKCFDPDKLKIFKVSVSMEEANM